MSLIPNDISVYYCDTDKTALFQGDIISSEEIGLSSEDNPSYWLIITKNCDLAFRSGEKKVKNDICSLLGLYSLKQHIELVKKRYFIKPKNGFLGKIIIAGVLKFSESTKAITKKEHIDNLIDDKISKLMLLPPDGVILTEPMIIDFDLVYPLSGEEIENVLNAKKLQLSSPFRERVSQRFSMHYSSIGIDDGQIKIPTYRTELKSKI